jgi:hypothetical protein
MIFINLMLDYSSEPYSISLWALDAPAHSETSRPTVAARMSVSAAG